MPRKFWRGLSPGQSETISVLTCHPQEIETITPPPGGKPSKRKTMLVAVKSVFKSFDKHIPLVSYCTVSFAFLAVAVFKYLPNLPAPKEISNKKKNEKKNINEDTKPFPIQLEAPEDGFAPHLRTFRNYLKAYSTLRPEALVVNAAEGFTHKVLPADLGIPARNIDQFRQHAAQIFSLFSDFGMTPITDPNPDLSPLGDSHPNLFQGTCTTQYPSSPSTFYDPVAGTVFAHCKMGGKINGETEMGAKLVEQGVQEWWSECILLVHLCEQGRKISKVTEFVHAGKATELRGRLEGLLNSHSGSEDNTG